MDHPFKDLIGKIMDNYQYELTIDSKLRQLHLKHLREVFVRCILFGISLNLKKCLFAISKGQLLGNIVSNKGIYIDPKIIQAIYELKAPTDIKGVQSFLERLIFFEYSFKTMHQLSRQLLNLERIKILNGPLKLRGHLKILR